MLQGLVLFSRLGVYIPLPGVDVAAFAGSIKTEGLLGYIDTLSGGSISRVGIFSLGAPAPTSSHACRGCSAPGTCCVSCSLRAVSCHAELCTSGSSH